MTARTDSGRQTVQTEPLRHACRVPALFTLCVCAACAVLSGDEAARLPVAPVVASIFAQIRVGAPLLAGSIGSAFAIEDGVVVTNRHVLSLLGQPIEEVSLARTDGATARGSVLARSERMDLGLICAPRGFLAPAPLALRTPRLGEPVWAAGSTTLGARVAAGTVVNPRAALPGSGEGMVARIGALAGDSGGPMVDASGRVLGITTAVWKPSVAMLLASLVGMDLEGIALGNRREVFAIGIDRASAEARSLLRSALAAGRAC